MFAKGLEQMVRIMESKAQRTIDTMSNFKNNRLYT